MPLDRRGAFQLGFIMLLIPAQYIISNYYGSTSVQSELKLKQLVDVVTNFQSTYLSWEKWEEWCMNLLTRARSQFKPTGDADDDTSPAIEVIHYRNSNGHFAGSTEVRSPRPALVQYRVGQVFRHRLHGYKGVIVGWDPIARAPDDWLQNVQKSYPESKKNTWRYQPHYATLVDSREDFPKQKTYVAQENIVLIDEKVVHPDLEEYFDGYNGNNYIPGPTLLKIYPQG